MKKRRFATADRVARTAAAKRREIHFFFRQTNSAMRWKIE